MSAAALFAVGAGVTLLVVAALALLIYAAILDGRAEQDARALSADSLRAVTPRRSEEATAPAA